MSGEVNCPVCGEICTSGLIKYSQVPIFQNTIIRTKKDAKTCEKQDIDLCICDECGFIFNSLFDENKTLYSQQYDNSQDHSLLFKRHLENVEEFISRDESLEGKQILEVGCGKGNFIKQLVEKHHCSGVGYDPSYVGEETLYDGRLKFKKEFYKASDGKKYDLIIFRHVIEHLRNPVQMLSVLSKGLKENGKLYIETPYFDWILKNNIIFDCTYEHCSYFEDSIMDSLLSQAEMKTVRCDYKFQGQYICTLAARTKDKYKTSKEKIQSTKERMEQFETIKQEKVEKIRQLLAKLNEQGKVCLWGAAGKGVMCCNLFDQTEEYIDCVVDINKAKQGAYIPGTGHIIIAPEELKSKNIKTVIVVNDNYFNEIQEKIKEVDAEIKVLSLEMLMRRGGEA